MQSNTNPSSTLTGFLAALALFAAAADVHADGQAEIRGGYQLKLKEYKQVKQELDEALKGEPKTKTCPVDPDEVAKLQDKQAQLVAEIKKAPENDKLRAQLDETIKAKYALMRRIAAVEVDNASNVVRHELEVIPILERFARRGEEFLALSKDRSLPMEQRKAFHDLHKAHLGTYARYAKRIRDRRNEQASRMTLALVNARSGLDRSALQDGDLLQVVESHKDYADAIKAEFVSDLKHWLDITQRLHSLLDRMELREVMEGIMQDAGISPIAVHRRQKQRRETSLANVRQLESAIRVKTRTPTPPPDSYGDDTIKDMASW